MIKILFLAANPIDQGKLRLDKEMSEIQARLRSTGHRNMFSLEHEMAVQFSSLQELLMRFKPHIVHFSGHGSERGECLFEDKIGFSKPIPADTLKELFSLLKDNIRCIVLNACYSEIQARAIAESIDCVIGMSKEVNDKAAIEFSIAFYQALGFGRNIKDAFELGCLNMELEKLGEKFKPHLIMSKKARPESISLARRRTEKELATIPVVAKILEPVEERLKSGYRKEELWHDPDSDIKKMDSLFDSLVKRISESKLSGYISTTDSWTLSEELNHYYSNYSQLPHSVRILQAFLGKESPLELRKGDIDELYPVIPKLLDDFRCGLTNWPELKKDITRKERQLDEPCYILPGSLINYNTIIQNRTDIFGGRSQEMEQIQSFIRSDEPGYLVVEGKSGMGKTALLANVIDKYPILAYHFFSIALSSQDCDLTKSSLCIHSISEQIEFIKNGWVNAKRQYGRESLLKLLQERYPHHTHPVLILDGLDEAESVKFMRGFFPKQLNDRLKVIFSYRSLAEKGVPRDHYLLKIGLSRGDIHSFILLDRLDRNRIAELFGQLAVKEDIHWKTQAALSLVNRIGGDEVLLEQITEKSDGDPFYLRFLAEDIRNGVTTKDNILEIPRGLGEYLIQEFENLDKKADGEASIDVIAIISVNDEPWPEEDLILMLNTECGHSNITKREFRNRIIPSIRRYLYKVSLGKDRHGEEKLAYTIIHPRLKEYFAKMLS